MTYEEKTPGEEEKKGEENLPLLLGVTNPICIKTPMEVDHKTTENFRKIMSKVNLIESIEEASQREIVLLEINEMAKQWSLEVTTEKRVVETDVILYTFGSYRLGVHTPGADIDVLCVGSRHITHEDFFDTWVSMLENNDKVSDISPVPEARVPVCKFNFDGIDIDMVYAQVQQDAIFQDHFDIFDDGNLRNMEMKSVNSLNGARVAQGLLNCVPDKEVFIEALRGVKYWAKLRGIYSNVMGYLGGISWAILIARVCQLFPRLSAGAIIVRFFRFYDMWQFGVECPIMLTETTHNDDLGFTVWVPNDRQHRNTLMAIITPCYPAINSTYRVTLSNYRILKEEFRKMKEITTPESSNVEVSCEMWKQVLKKKDFFFLRQHYILIRARCSTEEPLKKEIQPKWKGLIEAKIRTLVLGMELVPGVMVYPHPDSLYREGVDPKTKTEYIENVFFVGLDIDESIAGNRFNFSQPVSVFKNQVNGHPLAQNQPCLSLRVEHRKAHKLPDFCFTDDRRPKKRKKKKKIKVKSEVDSETNIKEEKTIKVKNGCDIDMTTDVGVKAEDDSISGGIRVKEEPSKPELEQELGLALRRLLECLESPGDDFKERLNREIGALLDLSGNVKEQKLLEVIKKFGFVSREDGFRSILTRDECEELSKSVKTIFSSSLASENDNSEMNSLKRPRAKEEEDPNERARKSSKFIDTSSKYSRLIEDTNSLELSVKVLEESKSWEDCSTPKRVKRQKKAKRLIAIT